MVRALALLPIELRKRGQALPFHLQARAEELRLRLGQPVTVLVEGEEHPFPDCPLVTAGQVLDVLELATGASVHTVSESIRLGFVTVSGGLRIGLCGTVVPGAEGRIACLKEFSSLAIRLPRAVPGCGAAIFEKLWRENFPSTLILSPPGGGKTTLLREWIRGLSERGTRVALVDERGEVAGVWKGIPQFSLGPCTDILTGAHKGEGSLMLLRAMNPQLIAMDEITAEEDLEAVERIANCGVRLLATAHGGSVFELRGRPLYRKLLHLGVFRRVVVITGRGAERRYGVTEL